MTTLTRFGGEVDGSIVRRDLDSTGIEYITVGSVDANRQVTINYSLELPGSQRSLSGTIILVQDGESVDLDNSYSYTSPELDGVEWSADISVNNIRLIIETDGLWENPVLTYRRTTLPIV